MEDDSVPSFELINKDLLDHHHHDYSIGGQCCDMITEYRHLHSHNNNNDNNNNNNNDNNHNSMLHHNTSAAYIKRFNKDFLRTAILASSRR